MRPETPVRDGSTPAGKVGPAATVGVRTGVGTSVGGGGVVASGALVDVGAGAKIAIVGTGVVRVVGSGDARADGDAEIDPDGVVVGDAEDDVALATGVALRGNGVVVAVDGAAADALAATGANVRARSRDGVSAQPVATIATMKTAVARILSSTA